VLGILDADGALAEEFLIPERNLVAVPPSVSDEVAVFAEPVAAACEVLEQIGATRGKRALVLGDGKLGSVVAQALAADGADVTVEGRHLEELAWLTGRGVHLERAAAGRFNVVVDATGSARGLARAIEACAPRGMLVLKTTIAGEHSLDLSAVVINEITVVGSRCGRLEPALERLADGRIDVGPLVSARYPLAEVEQAFAKAGERGIRKVLVEAG
jgi:threonine dehydrogenase-like Zn-dependent dehydrogenase